MSLPPNAIQPRPASWWSRNWKWVVPVGCGGILLVFALFIGFIVAVVLGAMRSTDAYHVALDSARSDTRVQQVLGTPIEPGWFISGNVNVQNDSGEANMTLPLSGPKGKGSVHAVGTKSGGNWTYSTLEFHGPNNEVIDLRK